MRLINFAVILFASFFYSSHAFNQKNRVLAPFYEGNALKIISGKHKKIYYFDYLINF